MGSRHQLNWSRTRHTEGLAEGRESNPHGLSHMLLRHARLPFRHSPALSIVLPSPYSQMFDICQASSDSRMAAEPWARSDTPTCR